MSDSGPPVDIEIDDEDTFAEIAEIVIATMAQDRGGTLTVYRSKADAMAEKITQRFPNGCHLHMDQTNSQMSITLVDADKCEFRDEQVPGAPEGVRAGDAALWGDHAITAGLSGSSYTKVTKDGKSITVAPHRLSRQDLLRINHAQHILLLTALSRTNQLHIEVTRSEFEAISHKGVFGDHAALQILRDHEKFAATVLSSIEEGKA